jgi:hypothetical protein
VQEDSFVKSEKLEHRVTKSGIEGELVKRSKEVTREGSKLGVVEVYVTTRFMRDKLHELTTGIALQSILLELLLVVIVSVCTRRFCIRPINRISRGLSNVADRVASSSNYISSASNTLAQGASEQAASLEETSSSGDFMWSGGASPGWKAGMLRDTSLQPGQTKVETFEIKYPFEETEEDGKKIRKVTSNEMDVSVKLWYMPTGGDPKTGVPGKSQFILYESTKTIPLKEMENLIK